MDIIKVILTSLLSVLALFVIAKIMGHKQISQLDFFDYITGITIGSIAAELATELEAPWKPLIAMIIYGGASLGLFLKCQNYPAWVFPKKCLVYFHCPQYFLPLH